jgi:hypothetical protein
MKIWLRNPTDGFDQAVVTVAVVLSVATSSADAACFLGAFGDSVTCNGRYFTQTGILPPLTTVTHLQHNRAFTNITDLEEVATITSPSIASCGVPVTYTNNPRVVDDWLLQHLPYGGSIIGFDVEVSYSYNN